MSNADREKLPEYLTAISFDDAKRNRDSWLQQADAPTQEAYRNAMEVLSSLKAGDVDPWMRGKIFKIIRKSTRYIIYLDDQYTLRWWWLTRPNERAVSLVQARISQLSKESAFLLASKWRMRASAGPSARDIEQVTHIRSVMGEALALALSDASVEECEAVLAEAKRYIEVAKDQRTRPAFLAFFLLAVAVIGSAMWLWICYGDECCAGGDPDLFSFIRRALIAAFAGGFGAMISAMTRTRDLGLEPIAGWRSLMIEAVARALIGSGTAILLTLAFDSGILLKNVTTDTGVQQYLWVFLCVVAGLSERILPALVGRAESLVSGQVPTSSPSSGSGGGKSGGGATGGDTTAAEKAAAEKAAAEKAAAEKTAAEKAAAERAAADKAAADKAAANKGEQM